MNDVDGVFWLLKDPVRRAMFEVLSEGPVRSGVLAERLGLSSAIASRQLKTLRDHGVVERFDVADDGRGRTYQLTADALSGIHDWLTARRWAEQLASREPQQDATIYQYRIGQLLDAIASHDIEFFETHVSEDAQFVFPFLEQTLDKAEVLAEIRRHPPHTSWDLVAPARLVVLPSRSVIVTSTVRSTTTLRTNPTTFHISAAFTDTDAEQWRIHHMQWTLATDPRGIDTADVDVAPER